MKEISVKVQLIKGKTLSAVTFFPPFDQAQDATGCQKLKTELQCVNYLMPQEWFKMCLDN